MAYNEELADRIRIELEHHPGVEEKKMFGGLAFMLHKRMFSGIVKNDLMVRVLNEQYETALADPHCREMDFTGKPMRGFVYIDEEGIRTPKQLKYWLGLGIEFIEKTPAPKKKSLKKSKRKKG